MTAQPPAASPWPPSQPEWSSGGPGSYGTGSYGTGSYGPGGSGQGGYGSAPAWTGGDAYGTGLAPYGSGPVGRVRGTGVCMLLTIVTFGIYPVIWYYQTHEEMKRHTGQGLGGLVALLLALFVGVASPFLSSNEVGEMYSRSGRPRPVTGLTGLWYIPGFLLLVGPFVWFIKTNAALNDYWRSLGAR